MQLNVGVLLVRPNGQVALPHSMCAVEGDGEARARRPRRLCLARLKQEPLLLMCCEPPRDTPRRRSSLCSRRDQSSQMDDDIKPLAKKAKLNVPEIDEHFDDLSKLSHSSLRQYAIICSSSRGTEDEELIRMVCTPSNDDKRALFPEFSAPKLLLQNAHCFPGMTLTVSADPKQQIYETSEALVKEMPSLKKLAKEIEAAEAAMQKRLDGIRKEAEKVKGGEDRVEEIIASKLRDMGISESAGAQDSGALRRQLARAHAKVRGRREVGGVRRDLYPQPAGAIRVQEGRDITRRRDLVGFTVIWRGGSHAARQLAQPQGRHVVH